MRLDDVGTSPEFFRCVYLTAGETPELVGAHALAREALGVTAAEAFRPHLSLVYGQLGEPERQAARREAGGLLESFTADALHLVDTTGDVPGWHRLARFAFVGP